MATGGQPVVGRPFTPWKVTENHRPGVAFVTVGQIRIAQTDERIAQPDHNAAHIASWHPVVALAVADWLDDMARWMTFGDAGGPGNIANALAVADAYLPPDPSCAGSGRAVS
jgi:hypothetical protein